MGDPQGEGMLDATVPAGARSLALGISDNEPTRRSSVPERYIKCNRAECPCADREDARHSPYFRSSSLCVGKTEIEISGNEVEDGDEAPGIAVAPDGAFAARTGPWIPSMTAVVRSFEKTRRMPGTCLRIARASFTVGSTRDRSAQLIHRLGAAGAYSAV